jgi:hypothetical protein
MKWLSDPRDELMYACAEATTYTTCSYGITGTYYGLWILAYVPRILILLYFVKWLILNRKIDSGAQRRKLTHAFSFLQLGHLFTLIMVILMNGQLNESKNQPIASLITQTYVSVNKFKY